MPLTRAERQKRYRKKHPERVKKALKRYRQDNPAKIKAMKQSWEARNIVKVTAQQAVRRKRWNILNPEGNLAGSLKHHYGITVAEYKAMHETQKGLCWICRRPETRRTRSGLIRRLAVDHCHATGVVRKLLCAACNSAIAYIQESPESALRAYAYLMMAREIVEAQPAEAS